MTVLSKWNPFRFDRNTKRRTGEESNEQPIAKRESWHDPFERMERQMNTLMRGFLNDDFLTPSFRTSSQRPSFFGDFAPTRFSPSIDVTSEGNNLVVSAELPGLNKDDVDVTIDDNVLTLKGEKRHERQNDEDGCYRTERFYGSFTRTIPLPADVDTEGVEANFDNGILMVRLPKVELKDQGPKRIDLG